MGWFDQFDPEVAEIAIKKYKWLRGAGNNYDHEEALGIAEVEARARQERKDHRDRFSRRGSTGNAEDFRH